MTTAPTAARDFDGALPIVERVRSAGAAGYRGFGLLHDDLVVAEETIGWKTLRDALADHGISILEIEMLNDWFVDGPARQQSDEVRQYLLRAAEFFAPRHLKVGGDITGRAYPLGRVAEEFSALCDSFVRSAALWPTSSCRSETSVRSTMGRR